MSDQSSETLFIVRTLDELDRVMDYIENPDFEYASYDTETTGLEKDAELIGYSIACEESIGIYVVLAEWNPTKETVTCEPCKGTGGISPGTKKNGDPKKAKACKACEGKGTVDVHTGELMYHPEMKRASKEVLQALLKKKLIMHNSPFDVAVTNREMGIDLMPALHTDTMELAHVLNENMGCGLKLLAAHYFGESELEEQELMKASVIANGGRWENSKKFGSKKEMYKADSELVARYGAKDTIMTLKLFWQLIPQLFEENLDSFFYDEESMPLMKSATYELNTVGIKVDIKRLQEVKAELTEQCARLKVELEDMLRPLTLDKYPNGFGVKVKGAFNMSAPQQLSWLLFGKCQEYFLTLTKTGKLKAKEYIGKVPYDLKGKRAFIESLTAAGLDPYKYMTADAPALKEYSSKHAWCQKLLEYRKAGKILSTYVIGIEQRLHYGVIHPSFLQHGTTSGRYSSSNPNFQNLPRDDKRVKSMMVARPGRILIGADYAQLEPRVFASVSQDPILMACFDNGQDFYSVVGAPTFGITDATLVKDDSPNSFPEKYKSLRNMAKAIALAIAYGTTAFKLAQTLKINQKAAQKIIDDYLTNYESVYQMMIESHNQAKATGVVYNLYGRPRRIPEAMSINTIYGNIPHAELPYEARSLLNLSMNHRVQSTGASIVNRSAIAFCRRAKEMGIDATIIMQIHDEIVIEAAENQQDEAAELLKDCMENTVTLPGVKLLAEPKTAYKLSDLK